MSFGISLARLLEKVRKERRGRQFFFIGSDLEKGLRSVDDDRTRYDCLRFRNGILCPKYIIEVVQAENSTRATKGALASRVTVESKICRTNHGRL